ncbi:MAG: hypothetical protein ACI9VS_000062 [Candidatus Binatia bacterium]
MAESDGRRALWWSPDKYHFESLKSLAQTSKSDLERQQLFIRVAPLSKMKKRAEIMAQSLHGLGRDEGTEIAVVWLDESTLPRKPSPGRSPSLRARRRRRRSGM